MYHENIKNTNIEITASERERYARQMVMPELGEKGQGLLKASSVLVIGTGGLGGVASLYLACAGIGTIGIVDCDTVNITNLQRQILYDDTVLGKEKVHEAAKRLKAMNPHVNVDVYDTFLDDKNIREAVGRYDFVIDATDNLESKFLINDVCVEMKKPFCHAGVLRFEGQIMTWIPGEHACYRCVFEDIPEEAPVPAEVGVIGAATGVIGSIQAMEAIKYITGIGELLVDKMMIFDGLSMKCRVISLGGRNHKCTACH